MFTVLGTPLSRPSRIYPSNIIFQGLHCYATDVLTDQHRLKRSRFAEIPHASVMRQTTVFSVNYTMSDGTVVVDRDCDDDPTDRSCPDADNTCEKRITLFKLKSCAAVCCKTDNCNNYTPTPTPGSATGIMVAKFTLCVMVILGFILV